MIGSRLFTRLSILMLALIVAGCGSTGPGRKTQGGGYYKDDGPHASIPVDLDSVPDAVPRLEPLASGANRPYVVFGKSYVPDTSGQPYKKRGIASWYGKKFHGNSTSNGETYDMYAMTAAHTNLPIPSYVRVSNVASGRTVIVRVNDRGPFHSDRIIDLSYVAAYKLGLIGPGSGEVVVEKIQPDEIQRMASASVAATPLLDTPVSAATPIAALPLSASPAASPTFAPVAGAVYLQLGAFSQQANAESLKSKVNAQLGNGNNPPVLIEQANNVFRVKMGPYADRDAALNAIGNVNQQTGILPSLAVR